MKNNCEVTEGSVLFEKIKEKLPFWWTATLLVVLCFLKILFPVPFLLIGGGLLFLLCLVAHIVYYYEGWKNGFEDETYKCYYFSDRLVFYRISNHLDRLKTKGQSTKYLVNEVNELIEKKWTGEIDEDILDYKIKKLEEAIIISQNKRQPHKFEFYFNEFEFFKSGKDGWIECINKGWNENDKEDETFFRNSKLTKEYRKCQNQIVDFLNKKVREAKEGYSED